jgi:hypothetical protein
VVTALIDLASSDGCQTEFSRPDRRTDLPPTAHGYR